MTDTDEYPVEKRPNPRSQERLGLHWARVPRLPHPGMQYVVAPINDDGTMDMEHGWRDAFRHVDDADDKAEELDELYGEFQWRVWSRVIPPFSVDDPTDNS